MSASGLRSRGLRGLGVPLGLEQREPRHVSPPTATQPAVEGQATAVNVMGMYAVAELWKAPGIGAQGHRARADGRENRPIWCRP